MPGSAEFDYVVVGAGSAGCVLAARLSQDTRITVLLLEAGSSQRTQAMTVPSAWPENLGSDADWANETVAQASAGSVTYPRGRALGGSGAINAMAHLRGHRMVYAQWAALGATGWGFADLLPYFQRSERADGRDPALRGMTGAVRVAPVPEGRRHPVALVAAEALAEAGCPVTGDLSGAVQEGVAWADLAICDGERVSPADAYLRTTLGRPNLTVQTRCQVTRLDVEHGRCTGVSYLRGRDVAQAHTSGEVILCAGAVASPQLLMLSGIGPAGRLRALGIRPVADVPGVGQNLQDHPLALVSYAAPGPLPRSEYNHGEVYAALRSDLADVVPDLHLFPILLPLAPSGCQPPPWGYALAAAVVAPDSRGSVDLVSADPLMPPLIDPGFLREPADTERLAAGLAIARQAGASSGFTALRHAEVWPGPSACTNAELRSYARRRVGSYYHPAGTCSMGAGPDSVVDPQLRVHGVAGLRVVDASVMPVIPNAPLHATVLAIAERAADLITGRH